jgi:hypothetical protein
MELYVLCLCHLLTKCNLLRFYCVVLYVLYCRYKYLRHPSYVGWFYWSIGTQCILLNPVCVVLYTLAAWHFFRIRIPYEEELLQRQYPHEYAAYMEVSYIGIPFIWSRKCVTTANTSTTSSSSSSSVTTSGRTTMTSITSSSSKAHQILGDKEQ